MTTEEEPSTLPIILVAQDPTPSPIDPDLIPTPIAPDLIQEAEPVIILIIVLAPTVENVASV